MGIVTRAGVFPCDVRRAVALAAGMLCGLSAPSSQAEERPYQGMAVTVAKTTRQCFSDSLQVAGVLAPKDEVQVRPEREGLQVSQILVEPGDTVTAGQVLLRLSAPDNPAAQAVAVSAPSAGTVVAVGAVVGAYASASAPQPLFRIVAGGEMELQGEVSAKAIGRIKIDQPAAVQVVGIGSVSGKVSAVGGAIDPTTQLGIVRIAVGNDARLRIGVFARATIDAGQSCGAAVPLSAVLYGPDGAIVQVVRGDQVETRRVRVGLLDGGTAEILEGLSESDLVVARAGGFLREGDRVRPLPMDKTAGP